jgi:hypothetical protein
VALLGSAVLAIWNDVAPGGDAEFSHWHTREHVPERVGVPGFLRGRRYAALTGGPTYFTLYETENLEVLAGGAYVARLNDPTPWSRRVLPLFRNNNRSACRVTQSLGRGVGGTLATLRLGPRAEGEAELRAWLTGTTLPAMSAQPGVVGVHLCEADSGATRVPTQEQKLRDREDEIARWIVLIEGGGTEPLEPVCRTFMTGEQLGRHGAASESVLGIYRLLYCLAR